MFETEMLATSISQALENQEHFDSIKFWFNYEYVVSDDKFPTISEQEITWSINSD